MLPSLLLMANTFILCRRNNKMAETKLSSGLWRTSGYAGRLMEYLSRCTENMLRHAQHPNIVFDLKFIFYIDPYPVHSFIHCPECRDIYKLA